MSKLSKRYVEDFIKKYKREVSNDAELKKLNRDMKQISGKDINELKESNIYTARRSVKKYRILYRSNWLKNKEDKIKEYYNSDGTRNEEKILETIEFRKKDFETQFKHTYKMIIALPETRDKYTKNTELSSLFDYMKSNQKWLEVYERGTGEMTLVFRFWSLDSFDAKSFINLGGRQVYMFDEQFWPDDKLIRAKNMEVVGYVKEQLEKEKDPNKDPFDYEQLFEYRMGSPKFIEYHLMKLPKEVRDKYKGKKWELHTFGYAISQTTVFESVELIYEDCVVDWDE